MHNFIPSTGGLDPQDVLLLRNFVACRCEHVTYSRFLQRSPCPLSPRQTPERGSESSQRTRGASEGPPQVPAGQAPSQSMAGRHHEHDWPMTTEHRSQLAAVPTRKPRFRCFKIAFDIFILFHIPEHFACMCMPVQQVCTW